MSKLDELIQQLCPVEVEWKPLGEVCEFRSGWGFPESEQGNKDGKYPFYKVADMNNSALFMDKANNYISEEISRKIKCKPAPKGTIIFPKIGATMATNKKRILTQDSCYDNNIMGLVSNSINTKFLFYYFSQFCLLDFAKGIGAVPSLDTNKLKKLEIPLPPLPVQEEIVRLLDRLTETTQKCQAELEAELDARKKQYEEYRNKLLSFDASRTYVEWKKIEEFAKCCAGATPKTEKKEFWENGTIPWMSSGEVNLEEVHSTEKFITQAGYDSSSTKMLPKNTVVVALAGQGKTRGTVAITRIELCTNQSLCGIVLNNNKVYSDYLYYYLKGQYETLRKISSGDGTRGGLNLKMINNFQIPLPPLSEQQRIVNILDRMDKTHKELCQSIETEIKMRKQQYEYYRNQLLGFKKKED